MTIETDLTTKALNVIRTQTHMVLFRVAGLRPNTKHLAYLDGQEYGFATKQFGKDLGEDLISDSSGAITVYVLYEVEFNRTQNFEFAVSQSLSFQNNQINQQASRQEAAKVNNFRIFEFKSPDGNSYAQYRMELPLLLLLVL